MITMTPTMRSMVGTKTHRFAKLWQIQRKDGVFLRFTDHNRTLEFQGFAYTPRGGGSLSANRRQAGIEEQKADFLGVFTSEAITHNDLWAGKYREARVDQWTVDWRYPFAGSFFKTRYWIASTSFDEDEWTAYLSTLPLWLAVKRGRVYARTCDHTLFSNDPTKAGDCRVNPAAFAVDISSVSATTILVPNLKFEISGGDNPQSNDWYNDGHLIWYTGANAGIVSRIKTYHRTPTPQWVELHVKTPNEIEVGDDFNFWRGCNKLFSGDCTQVFANGPNFGGNPHIPGTDRLVQ